MRKVILFILSIIIGNGNIYSQNNTSDFLLITPKLKIQHSLYSSIRFIDSRIDTLTMGNVEKGMFNKRADIIPTKSFQSQFQVILDSITDSTAKNGELLFQLRFLNFSQVTSITTKKGYCYIRAVLYGRKCEKYLKLGALDSIVVVQSSNVTTSLLANTSQLLTDFIAGQLLNPGNERDEIVFRDIINLERLEKKKIPVYNTLVYKDGLYASFMSFKNLLPDEQIIAGLDDKELRWVDIITKQGNRTRVSPKKIYAVAYNGLLYVATDYGYFQLRKVENDFMFYGKGKVSAKFGEVFLASFKYGIIGGIIAADKETIYQMKIDHVNGRYIPIKVISINSKNKLTRITGLF